jgi:formylglycine-generating enzyme required for sulfatase activity
VKNFAFWSVVLVLAALTAGCGQGPNTTRPSQQATPATEKGPPAAEETTRAEAKVITNSIGMKLALIPAGEFTMGSPDLVSGFDFEDQKPRHRVRITKPFYLGVYEVTQGQYEKVMGKNPSESTGHFKKSAPDLPVEMVSWDDAQEFCRKLTDLAQEKEAGRCYRLPTEAEWEYACRAGSTTKFCYGDDESRLGDYAWYRGNSDGKSHPVGRKKPNAWGLYDMHGNVWEWCSDRYDYEYYANSPTDDPAGPATGSYRVHRGGGWYSSPTDCRSAHRVRSTPDCRFDNLGFRMALVRVDVSVR